MQYRELLLSATAELQNCDVDSPELNAELLLRKVANLSSISLRLNQAVEVTADIIDAYNALVAERCKYVPLQYLLATIPFHNIELKVTNAALIPRPETEQLVDIIINSETKARHILDLCTGGGCIALALAKYYPSANVVGIDISKDAIELANENTKRLNIKNVRFIQQNIADYSQNTKNELIVCNPPYISQSDYAKLEPELYFEPKIALTDGNDGLTYYRTISQKIMDWLSDSGKLYFECGINQANEICEIYNSIGYKANVIKDFAGIDRFVCIRQN
ncbi:MAG: peptide chain release factor N(5)-glutamine methyltransferase [Ignavibacteria bacterium]|jgi:release factor glutamine methyltransferase|nr:peptide chain release factor N(5)-glutamine methyltransferase [Ignavibacteria bacterium]